MKIVLSFLIILSLFTHETTPMMQVAMKIAGEQILLALVQAAMNAVSQNSDFKQIQNLLRFCLVLTPQNNLFTLVCFSLIFFNLNYFLF